jgi:P27 family predicted phage terminase small subunit
VNRVTTTYRACRPTAKPVVCSSGKNSDPPAFLVDEIAIAEWRRVASALIAEGVLTLAHQSLLAGYCNAVAKAIRAEQILTREGRYYKTQTPSGSLMTRRHPAAQDAEEGWNTARRLARQLGITTSPAGAWQEEDSRRAFFK